MSFRRWGWYHRLVFIETFRGLRLLFLHVCIVAGICLPILILLAINRGHVEDLRRSLETNPTGRQVRFWAAQYGPILDDGLVKNLEAVLDVELIIAEQQAVVGISANDGKTEIEGITLRSTRPGDPILRQRGVDVETSGKGIILSPAAASTLKVRIGDKVVLTLRRPGEEDYVDFKVKGILDQTETETDAEGDSPGKTPESRNDGDNIGFVDLQAINLIHRYIVGFAVQKWGLPASLDLSAPDTYASYLIFCKKTDDMAPNDLEILREGEYEVEKVEDRERRTLFGLLNEKSLSDLTVYHLYAERSLTDPKQRLTLAPSYLGKKTVPDEVIIPWNSPRLLTIGTEVYRVMGCNVDDPCWLRRYMIDRDAAFDYSADEFSVRFPAGSKLLKQPNVSVPLNTEEQLKLNVEITTAQQAALTEAAFKAQLGKKPADDDKPAAKPAKKSGDDAKPVTKPGDDGKATAKPADGDKPAAKPAKKSGNDDKPAAKSDDGKPTKKPADDDKPAAKPADDDKPAKKPADDDKPAKKPVDGDKPAAKSAAGDKPARSGKEATDTKEKEPLLAVVPINLLAHMDAFNHGIIEVDTKHLKFVPVPEKAEYEICRLYAHTIDDIPKVVESLKSQKFVPRSEEMRIKEIYEQAASLEILVFTVGSIVFVFGLATVATVLWDSTNRKRKDIGILRIMGVSGLGVLYMVLMRAALIGVCASLLTYGVAWIACGFLVFKAVPTGGAQWLNEILAHVLTWKESMNLTANAFIDLKEDWIIACVALGCSLVGSIAPGLLASRRDPFDAVVQSKDT